MLVVGIPRIENLLEGACERPPLVCVEGRENLRRDCLVDGENIFRLLGSCFGEADDGGTSVLVRLLADDHAAGLELAECLGAPGAASDRAEAAELAAAVDAFLRRRGARERVIFLRRVFYCDGIADIARRSGLSEAAVKSSLKRTRAALRAHLKEEGFI